MIGIVILNFNNWDETYKCILSIFSGEPSLNYHIYLVDNSSSVPISDELRQMLDHPKITFLLAESNKGYSAGNNIGIKRALDDQCEEILITNNDIIFMTDSISNLKQYLQANENVGIVGPKVYLPDKSVQVINYGIKMGKKEKYMYFLKNTPLRFVVKNFVKRFNVLDNDLSEPFKVYAVSGCCFMISKQCARKITPFDEGTFLFEEENILGFKMEKLGYETVYCTYSEVIHAHGQSTKNMKAFSYSCFVESELYYFKKYLNSTIVQYVPLYIIRTFKFLLYCFIEEDYRQNISLYFTKTLRMLKRRR
ncbi:glycosyltransferase family 2 protein [Paenibacillus hemerocallicola]|uniref:Glycosyltransferase family 2 protein n=1 Tax=Paenibacillus hemerocallicola TaxID=1172614 RepID=A0A5C4TCN9_9BACL|nr:glycosyltransferase family 2 protein [Paenibacillus hemerocallicola]TNJ66751.1 glycosyltransferase family 2 protein [Paenibacillus hemerocallicola]